MEYLPLIPLFFIFMRPFTVLFHELGHAIPAILMTKQPVSIYIGSYGDPKKNLQFSIGLLDVWLKYNPLSWQYGLCIPSAKQISINKQIIYTLTGPLTSFVFAIVACYFTFVYDLHDFLKLILIIFLVSSILDLFINLMPSTSPVRLFDGRLTYNDGYQLKKLFYYKIFPKEYEQAVELYNQQKYAEAATSFYNILKNKWKDEKIYRLAISSFLQVKNFKQAKDLSNEFIMFGKMNSDDFSNAGISYSKLGFHDKAVEFYDKSLELNPNNNYSLNNKGFTLNLLNKFEEAIPLFDKAIEVDKTLAYPYNNRGLAKIKMGKVEEGLEDINYSFKLDKNNAYGYRNLGIYHLDKGEYSKALELFRKAKELDSSTHMINELIRACP
ncbi:MAG: tetratricopeptide repeat protein [Cryomorphaceae bacterium]|nr:tetratricopeptide repeat protein [Cryomorphaceae bacterium]